MSPLRLEGPRLIVCSAELRDAAACAALFSNPANTELEPRTPPKPPSVADYEEKIKKWEEGNKAGKNAFCVIECPTLTGNEKFLEVGKVIGFGGFNEYQEKDGLRIGDTGVMIDSSEWRKGYGSEAVRITLDGGFARLGLDVIELGTLARNTGMRAILERKFGLTGEERGEAEMEKCMFYRVTKEEWMKKSE